MKITSRLHRRCGVLALALTWALIIPTGTASAQSADTAVAAVNTPVFVAPDASKTPLRVAAAGTSFVILEEQGDWTRVQFQDPQWGRRVGFVATKDLRFHRAALEPMDLSVKLEAIPVAPTSTALGPPLAPAKVNRQPPEAWPSNYVVGRTGVTFGTRTAPLVGIEIGAQVAPVLQVYGAFDWHRDISPQFLQDISDAASQIAGIDINARIPAYTLVAGVKATAPRGSFRPYALGGFGYGRLNGTIEFEGRDVTGLLENLGIVEPGELSANKMLFEIGGGFQAVHGPLFVDVSYRFRKFLQVDPGINVSGIYAGAGVGF